MALNLTKRPRPHTNPMMVRLLDWGMQGKFRTWRSKSGNLCANEKDVHEFLKTFFSCDRVCGKYVDGTNIHNHCTYVDFLYAIERNSFPEFSFDKPHNVMECEICTAEKCRYRKNA